MDIEKLIMKTHNNDKQELYKKHVQQLFRESTVFNCGSEDEDEKVK